MDIICLTKKAQPHLQCSYFTASAATHPEGKRDLRFTSLRFACAAPGACGAERNLRIEDARLRRVGLGRRSRPIRASAAREMRWHGGLRTSLSGRRLRRPANLSLRSGLQAPASPQPEVLRGERSERRTNVPRAAFDALGEGVFLLANFSFTRFFFRVL
jgi:hypothetical protein